MFLFLNILSGYSFSSSCECEHSDHFFFSLLFFVPVFILVSYMVITRTLVVSEGWQTGRRNLAWVGGFRRRIFRWTFRWRLNGFVFEDLVVGDFIDLVQIDVASCDVHITALVIC